MSRDLLNHTNGKGDKDRSPGWRHNYNEINWGKKEAGGFQRIGRRRLRKIYRAATRPSATSTSAS